MRAGHEIGCERFNMMSLRLVGGLIAGLALAAAPTASFAGVVISVNFAPPVLPVYAQPVCPGDGYLWTPGYWAYGTEGYYWVPGVWEQPPSVGLLWTPAYWGFAGGAYRFNAGYWGPHVGFYGGVNYGFGYGGHGYEGGYWQGNRLFYNQRVNNINVSIIHNTYQRNVEVVGGYNRVSFNGGPGGVQARALPQEIQAQHEQRFGPTAGQESFRNQAAQNRSQFASVNGGRPQLAAAPTTRAGFGNQVNARQGNEQQRINQGVRSGQLTPGETRNVENRDQSIHNQVANDRAANGGRLTGQERQQVNQRQNNVSQSIAADKHNGNNDAAAAARQGRTPGGEQRQAARQEQRSAEHGEHPR